MAHLLVLYFNAQTDISLEPVKSPVQAKPLPSWEKRGLHVSMVLDGGVLSCGGHYPSAITKECSFYGFGFDSPEPHSTLNELRRHAAVAVKDGSMWVSGGVSSSSSCKF